jgi:hypothetical protein
MVARPPMVALKTDKIQTINWSHMGINRWHHHQMPSKMVVRPLMVARPPMVPLLAIWLGLLTWLPPKKMVVWPPMVARPPMVALKTDKIQTINWSHVGINRWHHHQTLSATAKKNGCATSYGFATSYGCAKNGQNTDNKLITRGN